MCTCYQRVDNDSSSPHYYHIRSKSLREMMYKLLTKGISSHFIEILTTIIPARQQTSTSSSVLLRVLTSRHRSARPTKVLGPHTDLCQCQNSIKLVFLEHITSLSKIPFDSITSLTPGWWRVQRHIVCKGCKMCQLSANTWRRTNTVLMADQRRRRGSVIKTALVRHLVIPQPEQEDRIPSDPCCLLPDVSWKSLLITTITVQACNEIIMLCHACDLRGPQRAALQSGMVHPPARVLRETPIQCWFNAGPPSLTVTQV